MLPSISAASRSCKFCSFLYYNTFTQEQFLEFGPVALREVLAAFGIDEVLGWMRRGLLNSTMMRLFQEGVPISLKAVCLSPLLTEWGHSYWHWTCGHRCCWSWAGPPSAHWWPSSGWRLTHTTGTWVSWIGEGSVDNSHQFSDLPFNHLPCF